MSSRRVSSLSSGLFRSGNLGATLLSSCVMVFFLLGASSRRCAVRAFTVNVGVPRTSISRPAVTLFSTASKSKSKSSSVGISDRSATSQSRPPFRMPRTSPDDSSAAKAAGGSGGEGGKQAKLKSWQSLGLWPQLCETLTKDLSLPSPTPVQSLVVPDLLSPSKSQAFLASTGSGKTLAYCLPLVQQLKKSELEDANFRERRPKRPRAIIIAPTRELVQQISSVLKSLSHTTDMKFSSQSLLGGVDKGLQRKALNRPIDILVATPGRLLFHWTNQHVFLGSVEAIVLDEMDTLLEQGFQKELRQLLYPLLYQKNNAEKEAEKEEGNKKNSSPKAKAKNAGDDVDFVLKPDAPRIILTSATMTQSVQKLLGNNPRKSDLPVTAKRMFVKKEQQQEQQQEQQNGQHTSLRLPPMSIVYSPGLHKAVPRLEQVFVDVGNTDKISLLVDVVASSANVPTIVFCNTAASVRAVQFALSEARISCLSYHGELNSAVRAENLQKFRKSAEGVTSGAAKKKVKDPSRELGLFDDYMDGAAPTSTSPDVLVCTDLAARGLDVPQVQHIVMFDFPLNALDYLHRSGRTARGTGSGKVTALVTKRDRVLALAIEQAVRTGQPLDGLSSRKVDYAPKVQKQMTTSGRGKNEQKKGGPRHANSSPPPRGKSKTRRSRR